MLECRTYTIADLCALFGIGTSAAYGALIAGQIPAIRIGRRWVIPKKPVDLMLDGIQLSVDPSAIDTIQEREAAAD